MDDLFVHFNNIKADGFKTFLRIKVQFEMGEGQSGPSAKNVITK